MNTEQEALKAAALACAPLNCADEAEHERRLSEFYSECGPEEVLVLIADNERLISELDSLKAESEQLRQNAYRYQVLRQADVDTIQNGGLFVGLTPENVVINGVELDQRTDAVMEEQRAFVHAVLNQPLYTCHACKAATPYPEPYRMYVKCACGETTAATAALAGHSDFGVFAWLYVKASNGAIQLSRSKQHAPGNWVENDGYSINPLYEGPEVQGVTPDAWAFRTLREEPSRDWKLSVIYPLTACEPGHLEVKALYKRESAPSS